MENILVAAWIPIVGLLYCLLVAVVFNTVWTEYKAIRLSVKRFDLETFIDLRDEDISPLIHVLICVCSMALLGGFMCLKYPDPNFGRAVVGSVAYLLYLVFLVIREIDDPCAGLWFIRHIPQAWLKADVRKLRQARWNKLEKEVAKRLAEGELTLTETVTVTTLEAAPTHASTAQHSAKPLPARTPATPAS